MEFPTVAVDALLRLMACPKPPWNVQLVTERVEYSHSIPPPEKMQPITSGVEYLQLIPSPELWEKTQPITADPDPRQ